MHPMARWIALLLLLTACLRQSEPPLVLGSLVPAGSELELAVRLAVEQANRAGGVNGRPVQLVVEDGGVGPEGIGEAADRLAEAGVEAVVGTGSDATDQSAAEALAGHGITLVVPFNFDAGLTLPEGHFRLTPSKAVQGKALAELVGRAGITRVALLAPEDDPAVAESFAEAFPEDSSLRLFTYQDPDRVSLGALLEHDPEAVVCVCRSPEGAALVSSAFREGLMGRPWYYTAGMQDASLPELAFSDDPSRLAGQQGVAFDSSPAPGFERFAGHFREAFGSDPGLPAAHAYDAALLVILSVEAGGLNVFRATSQDGQPCLALDCLPLARDGRDLDYEGASGDADLGEDGAPRRVRLTIWQYTLAGDVEVIEAITVEP
jgi:ABC-type branched-subunit amino acid transport system substrate-binding protein